MHVQSLLLGLLCFIAVFAGTARRLGVPYPIMLVIAGLLLSLVPGIPHIALRPDVVFLVFLPPLLYSAAWTLSWQEFVKNLVSIGWLAFGLVVFTVATVAYTAGHILPGFDWKAGFLLGAVVAATDPIAATATARRLGLPQNITHLLEAESLVNDGTGLLALQFGLAILVQGRAPGVVEGAGRLLYLVGAGVGIGAVIGGAVAWFEKWVDDGPVEIIISLLLPYFTYLAGNSMHASGVLAVIACGMVMSRQSAAFLTGSVRLQLDAVWEALTFVMNGIVFVLIGLQLPYVLSEIHGVRPWRLVAYGAGFSGFLIALRLSWVFVIRYGRYVSFLGLTKDAESRARVHKPKVKEVFLVGWTGLRGVLSLTAAVALPEVLPNGMRFPQRSMIIYLAFSVILTTLVLQGLTLPALIRFLKFVDSGDQIREEEETRRVILVKALKALERSRIKGGPETAEIFEDLEALYESRLASLPKRKFGRKNRTAEVLYQHRKSAALQAIGVEREALAELYAEGMANDETVKMLQRELDLAESRVHTSGSML
jgi:Na+/H+ antiporter